MIALTIEEIARAIGGELSTPDAAARVVSGSVETDSRLVSAGSIFFALPGEETDGHLFAAKAVGAGAALVIAERPVDLDVATIIVPNGVAALAALAREVVARVRRRKNLSVVAITGSNGKTTTKNMLRAILSDNAPTVAPEGSFNNHVGAPISMLRVTEDSRFLVVEMGASHSGEIAHLVSIAKPDIAVVLKVGLAHVGEFGGIDAVHLAKAEMVTELPGTATAILNADDRRVASMSAITKAVVRTFGRSAGAGLRAESVRSTAAGTEFDLVKGEKRMPVRLRILGEHHVMNALAALSVADELGLDLGRAIVALESLHRAERWRMEVLSAPSGAVIINDAYNASPDSMLAALHTLAHIRPTDARTIAVLGEMNELGDASSVEHARVGELVSGLGVDELIVVGEGAQHIHIAASRNSDWRGTSIYVDSLAGARDVLRERLREGDLVLVKSSKGSNLRFLGDELAGVTQ